MNLSLAGRLGLLLLAFQILAGCRTSPADDAPVAPDPQNATGLNIVIGRPTATTIALTVLAAGGTEIYCEYGLAAQTYGSRSESARTSSGEPVVVEIDGLLPDTAYHYRLRYRAAGETDFRIDSERRFHTQRAPGGAFRFGVQGDSHPERAGKMFNPELYTLNMQNAAAGQLDFYIGLGDDFSIERLIEQNDLSQEKVNAVYLRQRDFFTIPGSSAAVFLVNGNHEQAAGYLLSAAFQTPYANAPVYAGKARLAYYPLPAPDGFYSGDAEPVAGVGQPRDYYAWEWGDALFAVIDPYWHSPVPVDTGVPGVDKAGDGWAASIGDEQYAWLKKILEQSRARYKFVFEHHVLGSGRGAAAIAHSYEWGGYNLKGSVFEFPSRRPGWPLPMHQLMVKTNVTIFFFGHDHLFAREKVDTVVYQSVPNPADDTYTAFNSDAYDPDAIAFPGAQYDPGYGVVMGNSGYLRVAVATDKVRVEYVRAWLPKDATAAHANGEVAFFYDVAAR